MDGFTVLMIAISSTVSERSLECVELLLEAGADIKAKSPQHCFNMLHLAAVNQKVDVVRFLLKKAPDLCYQRDSNGKIPLEWEASRESIIYTKQNTIIDHYPLPEELKE